MRNICKIAGCGKVAFGYSYCAKHYTRWRRYGNPETIIKKRQQCSVKGCENLVHAQGFCNKHYLQMRRKNKKLNYIRIRIGKKVIAEHRYILEQHLGRKLKKFEHVHHINGNAKDNKIENLKILTSQEHTILHKKNHPFPWSSARPRRSDFEGH